MGTGSYATSAALQGPTLRQNSADVGRFDILGTHTRSASVTPRVREQAPQENTCILLFATTFSRTSLSGGQATGLIWSAVSLRMR